MNKKYFSALSAYILVLFLACSCSGLKKYASAEVPGGQTAALQSQWDMAFARSSGWTGGDVAASFVIPGKRILWVFGDSFIGDVEAGRHVRSTLVNNAIAVHPFDPDRPGKAPTAETINFFWGPDDETGKPTAWVRPVQKGSSKTWYWPTGGGLVLPGPSGAKHMALFLILLEKKQGEDSLWAFQVVGNELAIIDNVEQPAQSWKIRIIELPYQIDQAGSSGQVEWGVASLYQPGADGSPGYVFIYGVESDQEDQRDLLLARVNPSGFENFGNWEFFAGDEKWLKSPGRASHIVKGVASELSVDQVSGKNSGKKYVMVYSEPLFGERIFVRTASSPEGPWTDAQPVFTVSEVKKSKNYFAYAAKGHAALSGPRSLLVSYIVNSHDFNELANDASIYRPRFFMIPLETTGVR